MIEKREPVEDAGDIAAEGEGLHLGTCRMGSDPENSVTNQWHQHWDVPNLYVIEGSSVATGGVVNPTSTVCALALRAARHLAGERRAAERIDTAA